MASDWIHSSRDYALWLNTKTGEFELYDQHGEKTRSGVVGANSANEGKLS